MPSAPQGLGQHEGPLFPGFAALASDAVNTWNITGTAAGTLNGDNFSGIENLIGGSLEWLVVALLGGAVIGFLVSSVYFRLRKPRQISESQNTI